MTDASEATTDGTDDGSSDSDGGAVSGRPETGGTTTADRRAGDDAAPAIDTSSNEVLYEASPLVKPLLGVIATVILVAGGLIGLLASNPSLAGDDTMATLIANAVLILAGIVLLRLVVKVLVLRKTTYRIRADGFETSYSLLYKHFERTIPVGQLRGQELNRGRYQTAFGCATVSLLTGGTNTSLGFVEFEYVPNPEEVQRQVRRVRKAHEGEH